MPTTRTWTALGLMLAAPILMAQSLAAQVAADRGQAAPGQASPTQTAQTPAKAVSKSTTPAVHHHKTHKKQPAPMVLPPMSQGPLSQLPMDQIPATPAKVTFQDGLLSIAAQNSTLGEILRDVRKLTGASIDIPPGAGANERVVVHLGPGTPRDVLSGLLNGSSFNYVMLGSNTEPGAVATVLLTARPSVAGEVQTAANNTNMSVYQNSQAPMPPTRFPGPGGFNQQNLAAGQQANGAQAADADDKDDDAADADDKDDKDDKDEDQAQPVQPGPGQSTDSADANGQVQPDPNAGPKTPEQIMEMLRRSQQQQPGMPGPAQQQPPQQ